MTKEEWRGMVRHIVASRVHPRRRHPRHPLEYDTWYETWRLARVMRVLRLIDELVDDDQDVIEVFQPAFLARILKDLEDGVQHGDRMAHETGLLPGIEEYYPEIVEGMDVDDLPAEDLAVMRHLGSQEPREELQGLMGILKFRNRGDVSRRQRNVELRGGLREGKERVAEKRHELSTRAEQGEGQQPGPITRRWFKGLGSMCQGAALTIVDAGLVLGLWPFDVQPETRTVGAVVSITTGLGTILSGVGELRGE